MKYTVPEISDQLLAERLERIHYYVQGMIGVDKKIYTTDETNPEFFTWVRKKSNCDPRKQAFNFDKDSTNEIPDGELKELKTSEIVIKVGGYYGFLKMTMAEILAQVPEDILDKVVGFAINHRTEARIVDGGNYQTVNIIWFGKIPSARSLWNPSDPDRAAELLLRIKPAILWGDRGLEVLNVTDVNERFMTFGIWLSIGGTHILKFTPGTVYQNKFTFGERFPVYTPLGESADVYEPRFLEVSSYLPAASINDKLFALQFNTVDYFKTSDGIIHRAYFTPIYKD